MFGTAPNRDDVSVLANGAVENSEYDLRKQMNAHTRNEHTQRFLNKIYNLVAQWFFCVLKENAPIQLNSNDSILRYVHISVSILTKNTALLLLTRLQKSGKGYFRAI